jgi:hypothetical protein
MTIHEIPVTIAISRLRFEQSTFRIRVKIFADTLTWCTGEDNIKVIEWEGVDCLYGNGNALAACITCWGLLDWLSNY